MQSTKQKFYKQMSERMKPHQFLRALLKKVFCSNTIVVMYGSANFENPYQTLLYSECGKGGYHLYPITLDKLSRAQKLKVSNILHIHWEEYFLRSSSYRESADAKDALIAFVKNGGKIILTIHNQTPHDSRADESDSFRQNRKFICDLAYKIHVHNSYAKQHIIDSYGMNHNDVIVIEHPSYLGWYEKRTNLFDNENNAQLNGRFLVFGNMGEYKGLDLIFKSFSLSKNKNLIKNIHVAGKGAENIDLTVIDGVRMDVTSGFISDEEVPRLFSRSDFAVFGFSSILTSGSTILALSFGVPVIAPAHPGLVSTLPAELHQLLYKPNDPHDFSRVIDYALSLDLSTYKKISLLCLEYASATKPSLISDKIFHLLSS